MDLVKGKWKKNLISKALERCRSAVIGGRNADVYGSSMHSLSKSKSWNCASRPSPEGGNVRGKVAPEGCFSVYVGPQKQRFMIKTEYCNHPLFRLLLEDSVREYGYHSQGPIILPCEVELFVRIVAEISSSGEEEEVYNPGCGFLSPRRSLGPNMDKGYGSYVLLSPPNSMLKVNGF